MQSIQATYHNGQLELMEPVDWPNGTRAEVIPLPGGGPTMVSPKSAWPSGYFQETAGALAGEEFERP